MIKRIMTALWVGLLAFAGCTAEHGCMTESEKMEKEARTLIEKEKYDEALQKLSDYVRKVDTADFVAFKLIGDIYMAKADTPIAKYSYRKALAIDSTYVDAYVALTPAMADGKEASEAIRMLRRAIDNMPNEASLYKALGYAFYADGNTHEAIYNFQRACEIDPQNTEALNNLAGIFIQTMELDNAMLLLMMSLDEDPSQAPPHNYLGICYELKGDSARADEEFRKAISLDPNYTDAYSNYGYFFSKHGNEKMAEANYKMAEKKGAKVKMKSLRR